MRVIYLVRSLEIGGSSRCSRWAGISRDDISLSAPTYLLKQRQWHCVHDDLVHIDIINRQEFGIDQAPPATKASFRYDPTVENRKHDDPIMGKMGLMQGLLHTPVIPATDTRRLPIYLAGCSY